MRILQLHHFPLFGSGSCTFVKGLSLALARRHKVGILCADRHTKLDKKNITLFRALPEQKVAFTGLPNWPTGTVYKDISNERISEIYSFYVQHAITAVEQFKPDIIHAHHIAPLSWVANYIHNLYGIPFGITSHGTDLRLIAEDNRYHQLGEQAVQHAAYITTVSPNTKQWILRTFPSIPPKKITVIPGGIDIGNFPKTVSTERVRKKYKLPNEPLVLYTGRLTEMKGVEYLIKAAAKIQGHVVIVGDGPDLKRLQKLNHQLKNTNVSFLGYFGRKARTDLRDIYYAADTLVIPSVWDEPLGLVMLEAMAASTPVVATAKGGIPEVITNNYNGILITAKRPNVIAREVNAVLADDVKRAHLAENARHTVLNRFEWNTIAQSFEQLYTKVV